MSSPGRVLALDTPTLLACAKIPASTLNYWIGRKFVSPSIDAGGGRRATRYWTVKDLVVVKAIKALRDAGCSLQNIAKVQGRLTEKWDLDLSTSVLYYNGRDVVIVENGVVMSVIEELGQSMFAETLTMITFPLKTWINEGIANSWPVDVQAIRSRRKVISDRRLSA